MPEIYNLFDLQVKYRIEPNRILELAKQHNAKIIGNHIFLDNIEVKEFFDLLKLGLRANQLCQDANTLLGKKLYYDSLLKYEEAKKIEEKLGDLSVKATCHNNIGLIFEILEDFPKALMNFEEALIITKELGDQLGTALQLENIGRIYKNEKKYSEALRFFKESFYILSRIKLEKSLLYIKKEVESHIKKIEKFIHQ